MGYLHHAQEVLQLTNDNIASIRYNSWNTDTDKTGKRTSYELEVTLTAPKEYNDDLYDYLVKQGYNVFVIKPHKLEVTLKTNQAKQREKLTDNLSNDVNLFFENDSVQ